MKKFLDGKISFKEVQNEVNQLGGNATFYEDLAYYLKARNSTINPIILDRVSAGRKEYEAEKEKAVSIKSKLASFGKASLKFIKEVSASILRATIIVAGTIFIINHPIFLGLLLTISLLSYPQCRIYDLYIYD